MTLMTSRWWALAVILPMIVGYNSVYEKNIIKILWGKEHNKTKDD
jgi:hypothetical protein